jgi:Cu/Zn superoxide dismutase
VIHKNDGSRWACATIGHARAVTTVIATFSSDIMGQVVMKQLADDAMSETQVLVDLKYADAAAGGTAGHKMHVHVSPVTADCASAGGHFDPFGVEVPTYTTCTGDAAAKAVGCYVGDLSGKHGLVSIGGSSAKQFFSDLNLPLSGPNKVDGRSIVLHAANSGAPRVGCASLGPVPTPAPPTNTTSTDKGQAGANNGATPPPTPLASTDDTAYTVALVLITALLVLALARFVRREFFAQSRMQNCFVKALRRFPGCAKLPCVQAIDASLPSYQGGQRGGGVHGKLGVNVKRNPYFERQPSEGAQRSQQVAQAAIDGATPGKFVQMEGFLEKTDGAGWAWGKRWFVLFNDRLRYYESRRTQTPLGEFVLSASLLSFYAHPSATTAQTFQLLTTEESDLVAAKRGEKKTKNGGALGGGGGGDGSTELGEGARVTHFCSRGGTVMLDEWVRAIGNNMGAAMRPGALEAGTGALVRAGKAKGAKAGRKVATLDGGEDDPTVSHEVNPMHGGGGSAPGVDVEKRKGSMSDFLKFHFRQGGKQ